MSSPVVAVAALACALAVCGAVGDPSAALARLGGADGASRWPPTAVRRGDSPGGRTAVLIAGAAGGATTASGVWLGAAAAVLTVVIGMVAVTAAVVWRRRSDRRSLARRREEVARAGQLVAALLRVGRVPVAALVEAAREATVLAGPAAEVAVGAEPAVALRRAASRPGQEALAEFARAWEVTARTGGSLRHTLAAVAETVQADADAARTVAAEIAAARMAGRMMAVLPLAGVALGYAVGADPVAFLLGGPAGWVCLLAGVLLACAGVLWLDVVGERTGGR